MGTLAISSISYDLFPYLVIMADVEGYKACHGSTGRATTPETCLVESYRDDENKSFWMDYPNSTHLTRIF